MSRSNGLLAASEASSSSSSSSSISFYFHLLQSSPTRRHLRHLHGRLLRTGLHQNIILSTKLLLSYSSPRHRLHLSSLRLYLHLIPNPNSFTHNSIISSLSLSPSPHLSLLLFLSLLRRRSLPDQFTLPPILRSCAAIPSLPAGLSLHSMSAKLGLGRSPFVASALVSFYSALSRLDDARKVFDEITYRDYVLWTSMVSGYAQGAEPERALRLFPEMMREQGNATADGVMAISLLLACCRLGSLRQGRSVHGFCMRRRFGLPLALGNALVDMYVKCGACGSAGRVFDRMPVRDVISWSTLILGHGLNGNADAAFGLFERMREEEVMPNAVTFLGVLSACAHLGMVDRAWGILYMMKENKVEPELKHHACIVDALARAGQVVEAEEFVEKMPVEPDEAVLGALLLGCRGHGNVDVGERVARRLMAMRPDKSGYYAMLANMYSDAGRFDDAVRVRSFMTEMNVGKLPGCSLIELGGFSSQSQPT